MKISIAISILIVALAAAVGVRDRHRLTEVRTAHAKLVEEARSFGIQSGSNGGKDGVLVTRLERDDKDAEARAAAKKMIAFAKELKQFKESGGQPDADLEERMKEFMELMLSLNVSQLKILIGELRESTELDDESRNGMLIWAIMTLSGDHPEAALTLFTENPDLADNPMVSKHLLSSSLATWALTDPDAALAWVKENGKKYPDLITDDIKAGLVKGAGGVDLKRGFEIIRELGMKNPEAALRGLAEGLTGHGERTEFLNLLREFAKTEKQGVSDAVRSLAGGIAKDGFEAGSKWIVDNKLTPKEIESVASMIGYLADGPDKGQWISWMGENLEQESAGDQIGGTMGEWTRNDYRAAGEWLASAPPGPTKNAAIKGYAETVAEYDPATATQWALTLPEGKERQETLETIHANMPNGTQQEKAARKDFGDRYGIR